MIGALRHKVSLDLSSWFHAFSSASTLASPMVVFPLAPLGSTVFTAVVILVCCCHVTDIQSYFLACTAYILSDVQFLSIYIYIYNMFGIALALPSYNRYLGYIFGIAFSHYRYLGY